MPENLTRGRIFTSFSVSRRSDPLVNKLAVNACKLNNLFWGFVWKLTLQKKIITPTTPEQPNQIPTSLLTDLNFSKPNIYSYILSILFRDLKTLMRGGFFSSLFFPLIIIKKRLRLSQRKVIHIIIKYNNICTSISYDGSIWTGHIKHKIGNQLYVSQTPSPLLMKKIWSKTTRKEFIKGLYFKIRERLILSLGIIFTL